MGTNTSNMGKISGRTIQSGRLDNNPVTKQSVGALVYSSSTKRYLFLLRDGTKFAGTWGLTGGKVEADERVIDALYREINEETGTDLSLNKTIPIETFTSDNRKFVYYTFLVSVEKEFIPELNHEHRGYCWVELKDHPKPLHPGVWKTFNFTSIINKIKMLEAVL